MIFTSLQFFPPFVKTEITSAFFKMKGDAEFYLRNIKAQMQKFDNNMWCFTQYGTILIRRVLSLIYAFL